MQGLAEPVEVCELVAVATLRRRLAVCFEQALIALEHVPDSRTTTEQAIDLRLGLRTTLYVLGEAHERLLDHLRRAEPLAQTLGDPRWLGRVYAEMGNNFWVVGEVDRAIGYGQRALALAATLEHVGIQARTQLGLGATSPRPGSCSS